MLKLDMLKNISGLSLKFMVDRNHGKSPFTEEVLKNIQEDLASKYHEEVIRGLKVLVNLFFEGERIHSMLPKIINILPNDHEEVKRIAQYLVLELSKVTPEKNLIILSVSPLHKEVLSSKGLSRADSIRVLSSLMPNSPDIIHVLTPTLTKIALDKNAYVRRNNILAWIKIHQLDQEETEYILNLIKRHYFKDIPYIFGMSLIAYELISKDSKYMFLHQTYRRICREILRFTPIDQALILEMLNKYAYLYLTCYKSDVKQKLYVDEDLKLLAVALDKISLVQDLSSVIQASKIALFLGDEGLIQKYITALLKFLHKSSEFKYNALVILEEYAKKYPKLVSKHYKRFYIYQLEKLYCKIIKLRILNEVIEDWNFSEILDEYITYAKCPSIEFSSFAVKSIGKIASKSSKHGAKCIKFLVGNIIGKNNFLGAKSMIALSEYLSNMSSEKIPILAFCVNNLQNIESTDARTKLLNLLIGNISSLKTLAFKVFHQLVLTFGQAEIKIKLRTLELGVALSSIYSADDNYLKIYKLCLELGCYDESVFIRDFARHLGKISEKHDQIDLSFQIPTKFAREGNEFKQNSLLLGNVSHIAGYRIKGLRPIPDETMVVNDKNLYTRDEKYYENLEKQQDEIGIEEDAPEEVKSSIAEQINETKIKHENTDQIAREQETKKVQDQEEEDEDKKNLENLKKLNDDFFDD